MAVEVTMPKWGLTMKEGKITRWLKKEGERVQKGEALFEVETEKITNVVESPASGILFRIVVAEGSVVSTGTVVGIIASPGEVPERIPIHDVDEQATQVATSDGGDGGSERPRDREFVRATPAARRLAKELGLDLRMVTGSGPGGRITEADVHKSREQRPPLTRATPLAEEIARQWNVDLSTIKGSGEEGKITKEDVEQAIAAGKRNAEMEHGGSIPFSGMRRSIAEAMRASLQGTAQVTVFSEVDATEMVRFRDQIQSELKHDSEAKVSYNDIIILVTSRVLKRFPIMNSTLVEDQIHLHDSVNIGIAVALSNGLIVPVLRDADKKGLLQIAREARELSRKAREGNLSVDDVTGGTFTITNVGMFDVDAFTPILKPPETGILGVGRVKQKPVVYNGRITIRSMMFLSLTFDHQVVDGAPANEFLGTIARYLQHPNLALI